MSQTTHSPSSLSQTPWFDEKSESPLLAEYARKLDSFLDVVSDGQVDAVELESQEKRVVALMRAVEPLLSPEAHDTVTRLLDEDALSDAEARLRRGRGAARGAGVEQ